MAYGGQIINSDGTVWLSQDVTPLNMVQRVDITLTTESNGQTIQTNVPWGRPFMYFSRCDIDKVGHGCSVINQNGYNTIQVRACRQSDGNTVSYNARFYIFSNFVTNTSTYGINYYNSSGTLTWTAEMRPLQLYAGSVSDSTNASPIGAGFPCAVVPSFCAYFIGAYLPGTPPIYYVFENAWKAYGNTIESYVVDDLQVNQATAPNTWRTGNYFYINTTLYDY